MLPTPSILYNKHPFIGQYNNWLSKKDIDIILNKNLKVVPGRVRIARALVVDNKIRKAKNYRIELGSDTYFDRLANRIVEFFALDDPLRLEPLVFVEYGAGDYFTEHTDLTSGFSSQRTHTMLLYLNDNFTGGGTKFTDPALEVKPTQGSALVFQYSQCTQLPHSGLVVTSGCKYIIAAFVRDKPFSLQDRELVNY